MSRYFRDVFEQSSIWKDEHFQHPAQKLRVLDTIKGIPSGVKTLLDVGCGNGVLLNTLVELTGNKFDFILGIDFSSEGLKNVSVPKVQGDITSLSFKNDSFDLVNCNEVIEHLPQKDYKPALAELIRVSKKYILITVPNRQDLESSLVQCPQCRCCYNPDYHMRSFDIESMECLLEGCMPIIIKEIGPLVKHNRYLPFTWKLSRIWNTNYPPIDAICPQCGYSVKNDEIFPRNWRKRFLRKMSNFSLRIINWEVRKRSWILGLYVKIEMHK